MQPEWEEALKAQRERVGWQAVKIMVAEEQYAETLYARYNAALDNALRLARAIGAAEGGGHNPGCGCDAHLPARRQVEAIIRELGVE